MPFSSALSESRRLFLSLVDRRSRQFQSRENYFIVCEDCAALLALSLPRRLDNRVFSSSALSEARRIFLRYLSLVKRRMLQLYARVVVELELRYVQRPLLASGSEYTAGIMALLASGSDPTA